MNNKIKNLTIEIISALYILLFLYAAISKLLDFEKFYVQLAKSPILNAYVGWAIWFVPILEICLAIALMIRYLQLIALYGAFCLMVIFSTYIIVILNYSTYIPCSCGGIFENMSWNEHLIFNLFFVALGLAGVLIFPCTTEDLIRDKRES